MDKIKDIDVFINGLILPLKINHIDFDYDKLDQQIHKDLEYLKNSINNEEDFCMGYVMGFLVGRFPKQFEKE